MSRCYKAACYRADNPREWREQVAEIIFRNKNNPALKELAKPLESINLVGESVAMEILTAVALQLAISRGDK